MGGTHGLRGTRSGGNHLVIAAYTIISAQTTVCILVCDTGKGRAMSDFNAAVIAEFRANAGKVGGYFEGANLLLLHTIGAKSGRPRTNPLVYAKDGDRFLVAASKGGADTNPDWYYNLLASPAGVVEVGTEEFPVRADPCHRRPRACGPVCQARRPSRGLCRVRAENHPQDPGRRAGTGRIEDRATCNGL